MDGWSQGYRIPIGGWRAHPSEVCEHEYDCPYYEPEAGVGPFVVWVYITGNSLRDLGAEVADT